MSIRTKIRGTGTALVTPFLPSGEIDYDATKRLLDYQLSGGVEILVPLGTTGENPTISDLERSKFLSFVIEYVNRRAIIIVGAGSNNTRQAVSYTREAFDLGADGALVVTPYYNKPTPDGIFAHYSEVADVGIPILMYNLPGRTGLNMTAETTLRCSEIENIFGIKEASASVEQCMEIIRHAPQGFGLFSGEDNLTVPLIAVGAKGVISVTSNVVPGEFSRMVRFALDGKFAEAKAIHYELYDLMRVMFIETNPGPVKAALAMMGMMGEHYRLPMIKMREEHRRKVRDHLMQLETIVVEELQQP